MSVEKLNQDAPNRRTPDKAGLAQVVRVHGPWLLRWFESRLPPGIDADDLTQEVFLIVHRKWAHLEDPQRLGPYLYRIARRLRRRAVSTASRSVSLDPLEHPITEPASDDEESRIALRHALRTLPDDLAQAVVSYYCGEGTYEEVAARLGVTRATLQSRLRRGLKTLRDRLATRTQGENR